MRSVTGVIALALFVGVGAFVLSTEPMAAQGRGGAQAPAFQVEQLWPKPLPNHWILGSVTGLAVDSTDHIWIVHRGIDSLTARTEAGTGTGKTLAYLHRRGFVVNPQYEEVHGLTNLCSLLI